MKEKLKEVNRFKIVFDKLEEYSPSDSTRSNFLVIAEASRVEIDEISELRKMVLETTEPEPKFYSST